MAELAPHPYFSGIIFYCKRRQSKFRCPIAFSPNLKRTRSVREAPTPALRRRRRRSKNDANGPATALFVIWPLGTCRTLAGTGTQQQAKTHRQEKPNAACTSKERMMNWCCKFCSLHPICLRAMLRPTSRTCLRSNIACIAARGASQDGARWSGTAVQADSNEYANPASK
jgi:hypothetical protein